MLNKNSKIYITGHNGMVGSACVRELCKNNYNNLIYKSSKDLDLRNYKKVKEFLERERPEVIINAAAKVGGILANDTYPYNFLLENMQIQNNLISISHNLDIKRFIFLGSSCIYPKFAKQPIKEEYLMSGKLEKTNEWYAIAKISGLKLIESLRKQFGRDYYSLMPTNLYGPNDNFDLMTSHVIPALIRKFVEAKKLNKDVVELWGSGSPMREFLHVDDLASAIVFSLKIKNIESNLYNVGTGMDITIKDLARKIKEITLFKGEIKWDHSKPDGTPKKQLDVSKFQSFGWYPKINLDDGLKSTIDWYKKKYYEK